MGSEMCIRDSHKCGLASGSRGLVFQDENITGPNYRGLVFPNGDIAGLDFPNTASDGLAPSAIDLSLEYPTDDVVLFWQLPSNFWQRSPSSFVVDGVLYSRAEQLMMAAKARLFEDHRAVGLIMSSPDPSTHKRIGRGVRNFDSADWDREKQNPVLSGNYAKFTQNPAMKYHLLSIGNKRLAEASPPDPVWGIGLRADDRRANDPRQWRGKFCSMRRFLPFAKQFATVRPGWHTRPPLTGSVLPRGMLVSTILFPRRGRAR